MKKPVSPPDGEMQVFLWHSRPIGAGYQNAWCLETPERIHPGVWYFPPDPVQARGALMGGNGVKDGGLSIQRAPRKAYTNAFQRPKNTASQIRPLIRKNKKAAIPNFLRNLVLFFGCMLQRCVIELSIYNRFGFLFEAEWLNLSVQGAGNNPRPVQEGAHRYFAPKLH